MPKSVIRFPRFTSSGWPDWRQAWYVLQPGGFATGCCGFCCRWRRFFSSVCCWKSTPRMSVLRCIGSRGAAYYAQAYLAFGLVLLGGWIGWRWNRRRQ
ncbi:hypothethical protein [Ralstonia solanacearum PSI07]|nr:hypothethical protein [Ralstonia solanacearum PSI07]